MTFEQINATLISDFLDHLEQTCKASVRNPKYQTDRDRLVFQLHGYEIPMHGAQIQQIFAIPEKRYTKTGRIPQARGS